MQTNDIKKEIIAHATSMRSNGMSYNKAIFLSHAMAAHKYGAEHVGPISLYRKSPRGYWTREHLIEDALKYQTRNEWYKKSPSCYARAVALKLVKECTAHMRPVKKPKGYWTEDRVKQAALKYSSGSEWVKHEPSSYSQAIKLGILAKCCEHMNRSTHKPSGHWTIERIKESALRFKTRGEWNAECSGAVAGAKKHGIYEECCAHMLTSAKMPRGYWTPHRVKENALQYKTRTAWQKGCPSAYSTAVCKGLLEECCTHMPKNASKRAA